MLIEFPIEFIVEGTPISAQASRPETRNEWKAQVRAASLAVLPEGYWASDASIAVTMFYFPNGPTRGDLDNIIKLVLDALSKHIYLDDAQVERIVVQRFGPRPFDFRSPSPTLKEAVARRRSLLYIRLSDNPLEELR